MLLSVTMLWETTPPFVQMTRHEIQEDKKEKAQIYEEKSALNIISQ